MNAAVMTVLPEPGQTTADPVLVPVAEPLPGAELPPSASEVAPEPEAMPEKGAK